MHHPHDPAAEPGGCHPGHDELPESTRTVLHRMMVGAHPRPAEIEAAFDSCRGLAPPLRDIALGALLTGVLVRGPETQEVVALLRAALGIDQRSPAQVVRGGSNPVLLLAGSGKKGRRTLNVSTPAALVAAAAGARVIKVGSGATSSMLGSRELVTALGLREHRTADEVSAELDASGFAFVPVEPEIPLLDRVYGGRFHTPNPFSFGLAPLASPVRGDVTIFGLSHPRVDVAANVLGHFGMQRVQALSTRLSGDLYLDEIGTSGELLHCRARNGVAGEVVTTPVDKLTSANLVAEIPTPRGTDEATDLTGQLLDGHGLDSHRSLVALNAAYLLSSVGVARTIDEGVELAQDNLRSGTILRTLRVEMPAVSGAEG